MYKRERYSDYVVIFYYVENNIVRYVDLLSDQIKTMTYAQLFKPGARLHSFGLDASHTASDENLLLFKKECIVSNDEIKKVAIQVCWPKPRDRYFANYFSFYNHNGAALNFWRYTCSVTDCLSKIEPVLSEEFMVLEQLYNGATIAINSDYVNIPTQCYGYDFQRYYFHMLKRFSPPLKAGKKTVITELVFPLKEFGIYRVSIDSNDPYFHKIFSFNDKNHYISSQLNDLKRRKDIDVDITLLPPDETYDYNAYIYDKSAFTGNEIFASWHNQLLKYNQSNKLIKKLQKTLWGVLCQFKTLYLNKANPDDLFVTTTEALDITYRKDPVYSRYKIIEDGNREGAIEYVDTNDPFKHGGIGRIKYFLVSQGRKYMFNTIYDQKLETKFIRIHTDGIVLNEPHVFVNRNSYVPIEENKTTGYMVWKNKLTGLHICQKCHQEFPYKDFVAHDCSAL